MPAMTARLPLHPDRCSERPDREAKTTITNTTHMQHAITVAPRCVRRKDPATGGPHGKTDPGGYCLAAGVGL